MQASDFIEVVCAMHLSSRVTDPLGEGFGGLMVVGPPAALKTTFLSVLEENYHDALMLSDVNVQTLVKMRDAISCGNVRTLVLPELAKLYERKSETASNVEGTLRAMAEEGFQAASYEDTRPQRFRARVCVVGAMTFKVRDSNFERWENTGFNRRFLWSLIRLADPHILTSAAVQWHRIDFQLTHVPRLPPGVAKIPNLTTERERAELERFVRPQPGGDPSFQLRMLARVLSVLRWWYSETGNTNDAMEVVHRFAKSLSKDGDDIELPPPGRAHHREEAKRVAGTAGSALAHARWSHRRSRRGRPAKKAAPKKKRG